MPARTITAATHRASTSGRWLLAPDPRMAVRLPYIPGVRWRGGPSRRVGAPRLRLRTHRLRPARRGGGPPPRPVAATLEPAAHAPWRIREVAGRVLWESSPDGTAWVALASEPD